LKQRQHIRALERKLERNEVVVAEAIGETFHTRDREAAIIKGTQIYNPEKDRGGGDFVLGFSANAWTGWASVVWHLRRRIIANHSGLQYYTT
jgi:hypothetical protein